MPSCKYALILLFYETIFWQFYFTNRMKMDGTQAERARDALVKSLYVELHSWIVNKINDTIQPQHNSNAESNFIGILDMPGFGKESKI